MEERESLEREDDEAKINRIDEKWRGEDLCYAVSRRVFFALRRRKATLRRKKEKEGSSFWFVSSK